MNRWPSLAALCLSFLLVGSGSAVACVTNQDCDDADPCTAPQACHAGACMEAFTLPVFPLDVTGIDAYIAIATMDHSGTFCTNCCDIEITAFTGETAARDAEAIRP